MLFKIGFLSENSEEKENEITYSEQTRQAAPRRSVVQVRFPDRETDLAYYNDMFDLQCGDMVYVDGKLEGQLGRVTNVNYNFKIRISDYKRIIAVADTTVKGKFFITGSHFVTFDRNTLPKNKAAAWFMAPSADDEFAAGSDDTSFPLDNLGEMNISAPIADRGHKYYMENRVRYISVDGNKGYAVVEGSKAYEVEFEYRNGEIGGLTCSCFCSYNCKHEFAAMLQLKETLKAIFEHYEDEYERSGYFAAIDKATLLAFAVDGKQTGVITFQ